MSKFIMVSKYIPNSRGPSGPKKLKLKIKSQIPVDASRCRGWLETGQTGRLGQTKAGSIIYSLASRLGKGGRKRKYGRVR